jgi:hypothetical protein
MQWGEGIGVRTKFGKFKRLYSTAVGLVRPWLAMETPRDAEGGFFVIFVNGAAPWAFTKFTSAKKRRVRRRSELREHGGNFVVC